MKWDYEQFGITREQVEKRIVSIGAIPSTTSRGWQLKSVNKSWRIHLLFATGGLEIHEDTSHHTVHRGQNSRRRCQETIEKLLAIASA